MSATKLHWSHRSRKRSIIVSQKEGCRTCHVSIFVFIHFKYNFYEHLKESIGFSNRNEGTLSWNMLVGRNVIGRTKIN